MKRKVVLYIAMSIDGYIAKTNNDLSFLSMVQKKGEDYGYEDFISKVDTVILGRKTYDWIMTQVSEFPHADINTYVITHTTRSSIGKTNFYTKDLKDLVIQLKHKKGKNIFIDGGAEIANELLRLGLINELILSVIPVLLGEGIRLFNDGRPEQKFELVNSKQFDTGLVQLHYKCIDHKMK
jgi:dihydrofolate reductase